MAQAKKKTKDTIGYLSDQEYAELVKYKHYAEKTWYELFMLNSVTYLIEENVIPEWWSPNAITITGNVFIWVSAFILVYHGGTRFHDDEVLGKLEPLPSWVLLFGAFSIQWFSWFDMMDGQRARRLKASSPIGRLVDEAGDLMVYTIFALYCGYVLKARPGLLCLSYATANYTAYSIEMAFIVTGQFNQRAGRIDIGPVEVEVIVATIMAFAGIYGYQAVDDSLNTMVPENLGQYLSDDVKLQHALAILFVFLILAFTIENVIKSFRSNPVLALRLTFSPLVPLIPAIIQGHIGTPVYREHFVLYLLVHSFSTNVQTYRLLLSNMTRSIPYNAFGLETFLGWTPLLAYLAAPEGRKTEVEKAVTLVAMAFLAVLFYGHIYLLSLQWLQREGGKRKWWSIDVPTAAAGKKVK